MESTRRATDKAAAASSIPYSRLLWLVLIALILLRALASLIPGSWFWGVDALRDLPGWAWLLWAISAVFFIPKVSRKLEPLVGDIGRSVEHFTWGKVAAAVLAAVLIFLFPDQLRFVGDFLLRQGSAEQAIAPALIYPQALPLDTALHYQLPTWMMQTLGVDPNLTSRILGSILGGVLALLSIAFARQLAARGATLVAVSSVLWFGGWLLLFTGYGKAFSEMSLVILAAAILGLDVLRGKRSYFWFALLAAGTLWLHRSALGLIPAVLFLAVVSWKDATGAPQRKGKKARRGTERPVLTPGRAAAAGLILVFGSIALIMPKLLESYELRDAAHFSLGGGGTAGFLDLISPLRLLDDLNLILFLVPLAPLALLLLTMRSDLEVIKPREGWFLLVLSLPFLLLLGGLQPAQGIYRDFDTMAMSGMTLAIAVAVVVAAVMKKERTAAWLTVAIAVGSAVPVLQTLILSTDLDRGLQRIEAWTQGPPERPAEIRAMTWDYLGVRNYRARRYPQSTAAFARAAELAPSPRIVLEWATSAEMARDDVSAKQAFQLLLERAPNIYEFRLTALVALARYAHDEGDRESFSHYAKQAIEMAPQLPLVQQLARQLEEDTGGPPPQ